MGTEQGEESSARFELLLDSEEVIGYQFTATGEGGDVSSSAVPIRDDNNGEIIGFLINGSDDSDELSVAITAVFDDNREIIDFNASGSDSTSSDVFFRLFGNSATLIALDNGNVTGIQVNVESTEKLFFGILSSTFNSSVEFEASTNEVPETVVVPDRDSTQEEMESFASLDALFTETIGNESSNSYFASLIFTSLLF